MKMNLRIAAISAALTLGGTAAVAQNIPVPETAHPAPIITARAFVHRAAVSDLFEVQSARLAQQKSSNEAVKAFAARMVKDHTDSTTALMDAVQKARLAAPESLPTVLDSPHQQQIAQLRGLSGQAFDRRYMAMQIKAHQAALTLLETYGSNGHNGPLQRFAKDTIPMVSDHLQMAEKIVNGGYRKVSGL